MVPLDYSTPTDAVDCFRQAFVCPAVSPAQQMLSFVAVLSISYNFLSAQVLLNFLENWLLPQNNPISVII